MRRTAQLFLGVALLAGCGGPSTTEDLAANRPLASEAHATGPDELADLAALRTATAPFHRIEVAKAAGWNAQNPPGCFSSPEGGMGLHFMNQSKVGGTLSPTEPQLVMYEPQEDGSMRLVGVEFIKPGAPTDPAPVLFNHQFKYNTTFNVWALHVWVWKDNPSGIYADWNPNVSCQFATTQAAAAHP